MLVMIMAKLIQTTNEKVVYIYDGNMDPDNVDFKNVGIVEFDYCVFENAPNTIDAMYLLQNMEDNHIRIIKEPVEKDINEYGIDTLPFTIFREILVKYNAYKSIPDFAVRILFQGQYVVTSVVVYVGASDEKQLAVEGIVFVDGEISFSVVNGHYQVAIFSRG